MIMSIVFNADEHSYKSINSSDNISWISVTTLISHLKKSFDAKTVSDRVSKSKRSKWYGLKPKEIEAIWKNESDRAMNLGTYYHNQREADLCSLASIEREGVTVPIFKPVELVNGAKFAPSQKLDPGVYPEHMVYLKSAGLCGQSDLVEVVNGRVNIIDYKTNKEIKTESYKNWDGVSEKMLSPIDHLDDCNFLHYALQLSIYMYIILKHNPKLLPGKIYIHHIVFEENGKDTNGYPITKYDHNGDPVVKEVIPLLMPYLYDEVIAIISYLKEGLINIKKK
jgi:ATP-dependent exoDNAse (exonuclease V) beta subunit